MIDLKQWMDIVQYKITEGCDFCWQCFGNKAYTLDYWDGSHEGRSISIVFDTNTQAVYQVEAHDYKNERAYRYTNPAFKKKFDEETKARGLFKEDYPIYDLDAEEDWVEKATAIVDGVDYDTRIILPLNFDKDELHEIMLLAHENDMSLNKFIEHILTVVIKKEKNDSN